MNAIQTKRVEGDPAHCFLEKEDIVFEPFCYQYHPYIVKSIGERSYPLKPKKANEECAFEKYNLSAS